MTPQELKIYQEEIKKSPSEGKRNAIKRYREELQLTDMVASVTACQCEVFMAKKPKK
jgi:hypothetical protein